MGSFRTAARRTADQATLTAADRPEDVLEPDWLGQGESITYWMRLPHGAAARIASAATLAKVDQRGRIADATYDPGRASIAKLTEGIVGWSIRDENDQLVPWDPTRGAELLDGLPEPVVTVLGSVIGRGEPKALTAPADPANPKGEAEGNG